MLFTWNYDLCSPPKLKVRSWWWKKRHALAGLDFGNFPLDRTLVPSPHACHLYDSALPCCTIHSGIPAWIHERLDRNYSIYTTKYLHQVRQIRFSLARIVRCTRTTNSGCPCIGLNWRSTQGIVSKVRPRPPGRTREALQLGSWTSLILCRHIWISSDRASRFARRPSRQIWADPCSSPAVCHGTPAQSRPLFG